MSRRQISDRKFLDYRERDVRDGVEPTPARLRWLRAMADDFADEMAHDVEMDRRGEDRVDEDDA